MDFSNLSLRGHTHSTKGGGQGVLGVLGYIVMVAHIHMGIVVDN